MKKIISLVLILAFALSIPVAYAEKGASEAAYEHANANAIFNRVSDWFATIGKTEAEKKQILVERKAKRKKIQAETEAKKKKEEALKKAEEKKKAMKEKMKKY